MLKNSDDKVYKIAKSLGYENTKYFFRVFKKLTGYTPEEYRMLMSDG
jgi:two-component system response regulator YesN